MLNVRRPFRNPRRNEKKGNSMLTNLSCVDEGYRLTYGGYDFLACRTFAKRDTVYSVGNQIGTGKESGALVVPLLSSARRLM